MRRSPAPIWLALPLLALLTAATAIAAPASSPVRIDGASFRYERTLEGPEGRPLIIRPDAALIGHTRDGFSDLRLLDARDRQVAWRVRPEVAAAPLPPLSLLNVGWEDGVLVAQIDLGPERRIVDRLSLRIPGSGYVGRVEVLASDDRAVFRTLGRTLVYDLRGANRSRSTTVVFRRTDLRYLELRATGIPGITGATLVGSRSVTRFRAWDVRAQSRRERARVTVITLDLGYSLPFEAIEIRSLTPRYERPLVVLGKAGAYWQPLAEARMFRFSGTRQAPIAIYGRTRYLRLRIANGDDQPLRSLTVRVLAEPPSLLVDARGAQPYRLVYGSRSIGEPDYDFARLPVSELTLERAVPATLGVERVISAAPAPERSFLDRHSWLIEVALGLAALTVGAVGFVALRSKA
jgi:hypothetical protein